jgi:DeoR/GlpR family transcriptional regulator of sugar metabolism
MLSPMPSDPSAANLLAEQRRDHILATVLRSGSVRVADLIAQLGVSATTIRRDLDALERDGRLTKVFGGAAAAAESRAHEPGSTVKSVRGQREEDEIARLAAAQVHPGMAIALAAGTTTHNVARHLLEVENLTVVTNSPRVADVLLSAPARLSRRPTVIITGGIRTPSHALVGPVADAAIRSLNVDLLVIGCHGVTLTHGLTTPNLAEAETNRAFVESARQILLAADHTKWGIVGLSTFARLDQIGVLVTDAGMPAAERHLISDHVGQLLIAQACVEADEPVGPATQTSHRRGSRAASDSS